MDKINDGGPAFPTGSIAKKKEFAGDRAKVVHVTEFAAVHAGMTLRDYFAAKALGGILADPNVTIDTAEDADRLAAAVYRLADAMLRARGEA
jgi:hypothetical protein